MKYVRIIILFIEILLAILIYYSLSKKRILKKIEIREYFVTPLQFWLTFFILFLLSIFIPEFFRRNIASGVSYIITIIALTVTIYVVLDTNILHRATEVSILLDLNEILYHATLILEEATKLQCPVEIYLTNPLPGITGAEDRKIFYHFKESFGHLAETLKEKVKLICYNEEGTKKFYTDSQNGWGFHQNDAKFQSDVLTPISNFINFLKTRGVQVNDNREYSRIHPLHYILINPTKPRAKGVIWHLGVPEPTQKVEAIGFLITNESMIRMLHEVFEKEFRK